MRNRTRCIVESTLVIRPESFEIDAPFDVDYAPAVDASPVVTGIVNDTGGISLQHQ